MIGNVGPGSESEELIRQMRTHAEDGAAPASIRTVRDSRRLSPDLQTKGFHEFLTCALPNFASQSQSGKLARRSRDSRHVLSIWSKLDDQRVGRHINGLSLPSCRQSPH